MFKEDNAVPIGGLALFVVIATFIVVYNLSHLEPMKGSNVDNPVNLTSNQETPTLSEKSKCSEDGSIFVSKYEQSNNMANSSGARPVWASPEYAFDPKTNTCLAYIGYTQETSQSGDYINEFTIYTEVYNLIFDIYSNKVLAQGDYDRVTKNSNNTDTLTQFPIYPDAPNLDSASFFSVKKTMFGE